MTNDSFDSDQYPWVSEFRQDYVNGLSVVKRSVDATPMVMRKYDIGPNEVMTFSSYEKRNQALSVFHFHPDFPHEDRRYYMQQHTEGYEVAEEAMYEQRHVAEQQQSQRKTRLKSIGRSIAVTFHAIAFYALTNHPDAR